MASSFDVDTLSKIHRRTSGIRILAHVDHGKTTMADALLASNGIISSRLSGKLRYLDSRADEQERGITMKSSAVTILHKYCAHPYIVNVIDSPGHVDFSSEVSSAARLSDGAVIIVDVVEGVSAQTHAVLRQAWAENITPCLVLNKVDRLVFELGMTPMEAYNRLIRVLEQVNAVTAGFFTTSVIEKLDQQTDDMGIIDEDVVDQDDSGLYFEPERGNVVFASAIDGWGFTVFDFSDMLAKKLGCNAPALRRCLWGDYYLSKEKGSVKVRRGAHDKGKIPLFVKFVLEPIWAMYQVVIEETDLDKMKKMAASIGVKVSARDWQADSKTLIQNIMSQWLPLASCVLNVICASLPAPTQMTNGRARALLFSGNKGHDEEIERNMATRRIFDAIVRCDHHEDNPIVAFVSKMVAFETSMLPENQKPKTSCNDLAARRDEIIDRLRCKNLESDPHNQIESNDEQQQQLDQSPYRKSNYEKDELDLSNTSHTSNQWTLLAYTRVYAGTLRPGMQVNVLDPRYDHHCPGKHRSIATVDKIYLLMGRSLVPLKEAPAGTVVGLSGLEGHVLKSATLSSTPECPRFCGLYEQARPIVRVALATERITDIPALHRGMQLLNKVDPCVEVLVQETGELVLVAAGEVHIERCLTDLRDHFIPGVKISVSPPIVPYRETLVSRPTKDVTNEEISITNTRGHRHCYLLDESVQLDDDDVVSVYTATRRWIIKIQACPLPENVVRLLDEHTSVLRQLSLAMNEHARNISRTLRTHPGELETDTGETGEIQLTDPDQTTKNYPTESGILFLLLYITFRENFTIGGVTTHFPPSLLQDIIQVFDNSQIEKSSENTINIFFEKLKQSFRENGKQWEGTEEHIASFGPHHQGANVLIFNSKLPYPAVFSSKREAPHDSMFAQELLAHLNPIIVSFQLITQAGPLCEEPMRGVAFKITDIQVDDTAEYPERLFSGHLISTLRDGFRQAYLVRDVRLMTAVYSCDLIVNSGNLGKVYAVLNKRNGKIISETMQEGSDNFQIKARMPVTHSFGFAEELRKRTSGLATPQLLFSHWEVINEDPFWVPTTEEEKLHFGEKGDAPNMARKYMDDTRKRKGLYVERKIVEFAEKQRTITRNK
eukprot:gene5507-167_t